MILRSGLLLRHGLDIRNINPNLTGLADNSVDENSGSGPSDSLPSSMLFGGDYGLGKSGESRSYVQQTPLLSKSATAGIAVGLIVATLIVVGLIMWLCTRKPKPRQQASLAEQDYHQQHREGSVVLAKSASGLPAQGEGHDTRHDIGIDLYDKPPAYDEIIQQSDLHQRSQVPLQGLGSVSNGFRRYFEQPAVVDSTPENEADGKDT